MKSDSGYISHTVESRLLGSQGTMTFVIMPWTPSKVSPPPLPHLPPLIWTSQCKREKSLMWNPALKVNTIVVDACIMALNHEKVSLLYGFGDEFGDEFWDYLPDWKILDSTHIWKVSLQYVFGHEFWDYLTDWKILDIANIWKVFLLYGFGDVFSDYLTEWKISDIPNIWKVSLLYAVVDGFWDEMTVWKFFDTRSI